MQKKIVDGVEILQKKFVIIKKYQQQIYRFGVELEVAQIVVTQKFRCRQAKVIDKLNGLKGN
jgi:hypothetical protein